MDFKLSHSAGELLDLFPEEDLETVDVDRPSVLSDRPQKEFAIPQQELRHLYDGEGPRAASPLTASWWTAAGWATATGRSRRRGTRIGIAAGASPPEMRATAIWTTPGRSGIYHLNTLCNYDPDIIPLLDSEPGTAWCRDQSGVFRPELYQPDEE